MSRRFDVSLVVTSKSISLNEVAALLARAPQDGSHDKDEIHPKGTAWGTTIWRENAPDPTAPFVTQCEQLLDSIPSKCSELLTMPGGDFVVLIDVAAYFREPYLGLLLSPGLIQKIAAAGIGVEITAYPVDEENAGDMR